MLSILKQPNPLLTNIRNNHKTGFHEYITLDLKQSRRLGRHILSVKVGKYNNTLSSFHRGLSHVELIKNNQETKTKNASSFSTRTLALIRYTIHFIIVRVYVYFFYYTFCLLGTSSVNHGPWQDQQSSWRPKAWPTEGKHHEVLVMVSGSFVRLSTMNGSQCPEKQSCAYLSV